MVNNRGWGREVAGGPGKGGLGGLGGGIRDDPVAQRRAKGKDVCPSYLKKNPFSKTTNTEGRAPHHPGGRVLRWPPRGLCRADKDRPGRVIAIVNFSKRATRGKKTVWGGGQTGAGKRGKHPPHATTVPRGRGGPKKKGKVRMTASSPSYWGLWGDPRAKPTAPGVDRGPQWQKTNANMSPGCSNGRWGRLGRRHSPRGGDNGKTRWPLHGRLRRGTTKRRKFPGFYWKDFHATLGGPFFGPCPAGPCGAFRKHFEGSIGGGHRGPGGGLTFRFVQGGWGLGGKKKNAQNLVGRLRGGGPPLGGGGGERGRRWATPRGPKSQKGKAKRKDPEETNPRNPSRGDGALGAVCGCGGKGWESPKATSVLRGFSQGEKWERENRGGDSSGGIRMGGGKGGGDSRTKTGFFKNQGWGASLGTGRNKGGAGGPGPFLGT